MGKKGKRNSNNSHQKSGGKKKNGVVSEEEDLSAATTTTTSKKGSKGNHHNQQKGGKAKEGRGGKKNNKKGRKDNNNSDIDNTFRASLQADGRYSIIEIDADGNCLFRSISDQLFHDHGKKHYSDVRSAVCDYMERMYSAPCVMPRLLLFEYFHAYF